MKSPMENFNFDKKTRTQIINSQNMMKQAITNGHNNNKHIFFDRELMKIENN